MIMFHNWNKYTTFGTYVRVMVITRLVDFASKYQYVYFYVCLCNPAEGYKPPFFIYEKICPYHRCGFQEFLDKFLETCCQRAFFGLSESLFWLLSFLKLSSWWWYPGVKQLWEALLLRFLMQTWNKILTASIKDLTKIEEYIPIFNRF